MTHEWFNKVLIIMIIIGTTNVSLTPYTIIYELISKRVVHEYLDTNVCKIGSFLMILPNPISLSLYKTFQLMVWNLYEQYNWHISLRDITRREFCSFDAISLNIMKFVALFSLAVCLGTMDKTVDFLFAKEQIDDNYQLRS